MRHYIFILLALLLALPAAAQSGSSAYQFLNVAPNSHTAALGGLNISLRDNEVTSAVHNPALLSTETHNTLSMNYASYLASIKFGTVGYGYNVGENLMAAVINYVDYGRYEGYDEAGIYTGRFTAKDYAVHLIYARRLNSHFTAGATLKPLYSAYERYTAFALAVDMGASFTSADSLLSVGLAMRNAGVQLKGFHDDEDGGQHREALPFSIDLGLTYKLAHAPLRFTLTLHDLQRWDLSHEVTNQYVSSLNGLSTLKSDHVKWGDMLLRHVSLGADVLLGRNLYATLGYNHRRSAEMQTGEYRALSGFSLGAGLRLYKFHAGFGMTQYMKGNTAYHFSLTTHLNDFKR